MMLNQMPQKLQNLILAAFMLAMLLEACTPAETATPATPAPTLADTATTTPTETATVTAARRVRSGYERTVRRLGVMEKLVSIAGILDYAKLSSYIGKGRNLFLYTGHFPAAEIIF